MLKHLNESFLLNHRIVLGFDSSTHRYYVYDFSYTDDTINIFATCTQSQAESRFNEIVSTYSMIEDD